jgi:curved DNA-binding protein CbpA
MRRSLDELDYYSLLGVEPDASVDAIKVAFRNFARRFHPDRYAGDPERASEASRVYRRATEGYRVLMNLGQRRIYDEVLRRGQLRMPTDAARPSLHPSGSPRQADSYSPRARAFVARAEQALKSGDHKQARLNFQVALQHDPNSRVLRQKLADLDAEPKAR